MITRKIAAAALTIILVCTLAASLSGCGYVLVEVKKGAVTANQP